MYKQRLKKLNETMNSIISDYIKEYELEVGKIYRVETTDGKIFDGYFKGIHSYGSSMGGKINIWVSFFKQKKNYTPSKRTTEDFIGGIKNIDMLPF